MTDKYRRVTTPEFRVSFPEVFKAKAFDENQEAKFGLTALFPKSADMSALKKLAADTAKAKWGDQIPKNLRSPILDGDKKEKQDTGEPDPNYADQWYINLKSKRKPGLVDASLQPIIDPDEFYGGCYARATVTCYAYGGKGTAFKPGVALGLQNIQKLRDGDAFGMLKPDAEDDFEAVAGSSEDKEAYSDNEEDIFN